MKVWRISTTLASAGLLTGLLVMTTTRAQSPPTSAKIDTSPLELIAAERFLIPAILEPIRKVSLVATAEGIVRSQDAKAGTSVRENQDIAQLDRTLAAAGLKIAQAEVKELQAAYDETKAGQPSKTRITQAQARLEAAQARVELAQVALDRCTLRAPFAGRVMASHVSDGQYVEKGKVIAELADVSSLRVFVPIGRTGATVGGTLTLNVEGSPVEGKLQALLPLPDSLANLRGLATPLAGAWVTIPNGPGTLEPGQRVVSPILPTLPVATIPAHAVLKGEEKGSSPRVQVIRNEYVENVNVRVLGSPSPDRVQLTGALRPTDSLIVSSSVPLLPGTLIRFSGASSGKVEATTPNPTVAGESADLTPPLGETKSLLKKTRTMTRPPGTTPKSSTKSNDKSVPF